MKTSSKRFRNTRAPQANSNNSQVEGNCSEPFVDKKMLAGKLCLSVSMIDKLIAEGMPHLKIGRSVRFRFSEVKEYLLRR